MLLLVLGGVFLLGFTEAVNVAIPLVAVFLALNAVVIVGGADRRSRPTRSTSQTGWPPSPPHKASRGHCSLPALIAFPLLVLGLSGFETGVSMMPLVSSKGETAAARLDSRIRNTRKLLTLAAAIMSVYLLTSSLVTTLLIPAEAFEPGGEANGRALAYLAHEYFGEAFGTVYDISTVLILWFAGASAMAGLINIVPRYLPTYGMAPEWSRAVRPVVLVYTAISIIITIGFQADVNAQAGAYATGILAMMVSASFAVLISTIRRRRPLPIVGFSILTLVLAYALVANIIEKPDGLAISALFILGIVVISLVSRVSRTTEIRAERLEFDDTARRFIAESLQYDGRLNIIANRPETGEAAEYLQKERAAAAPEPGPGTCRRALPRDQDRRPVRVPRGAARHRHRRRGIPRAPRGEPRGAQRHRRNPDRPARCHRRATPRVLRMVRGQPAVTYGAVSASRARRHRARRARDPPRGRQGSRWTGPSSTSAGRRQGEPALPHATAARNREPASVVHWTGGVSRSARPHDEVRTPIWSPRS